MFWTFKNIHMNVFECLCLFHGNSLITVQICRKWVGQEKKHKIFAHVQLLIIVVHFVVCLLVCLVFLSHWKLHFLKIFQDFLAFTCRQANQRFLSCKVKCVCFYLSCWTQCALCVIVCRLLIGLHGLGCIITCCFGRVFFLFLFYFLKQKIYFLLEVNLDLFLVSKHENHFNPPPPLWEFGKTFLTGRKMSLNNCPQKVCGPTWMSPASMFNIQFSFKC